MTTINIKTTHAFFIRMFLVVKIEDEAYYKPFDVICIYTLLPNIKLVAFGILMLLNTKGEYFQVFGLVHPILLMLSSEIQNDFSH